MNGSAVRLHMGDTQVQARKGRTVTKAVIYIRSATNSPAQLDEQRAACESLAKSRGWDVIAVMSDQHNRSRSRPNFDYLMRTVDEGSIDYIIVTDMQRLTRNSTELAGIIVRCNAADTSIITADGMLNTGTASGRAMATVLGAWAESESDRVSERIKRGIRARKERLAAEKQDG